MVARATSAQSFLRSLPHTLLRLVPPSAGRPRCAAPPSQLPVSTRSAFFRQVRHEKRRPFAPSLCMVARATSAQSFLRTLPHTLLRLVPPSAGRPRCAAPPSQLPVSTRSAFFRQVRHEKRRPFAPSLCMVARATSAQSFLRTLPHTLLRLVPPSAGRPRCVALRFPLSSPTRNAFFRQVHHKKTPLTRRFFVVDLRGLEPRSYRVRLRTLHV